MYDKFPTRKPWKLTALIVTAFVVLAGVLAVILNSCQGPKTFEGYLVCQHCGLAGKCVSANAPNGLDLTANPEKHTMKCNKMADCIVSGYGVMVKQSDGKYKFCRFDSAGSTMALDNIIYVSKKTDNLLVEVKGKLKGNTIAAESITEK